MELSNWHRQQAAAIAGTAGDLGPVTAHGVPHTRSCVAKGNHRVADNDEENSAQAALGRVSAAVHRLKMEWLQRNPAVQEHRQERAAYLKAFHQVEEILRREMLAEELPRAPEPEPPLEPCDEA